MTANALQRWRSERSLQLDDLEAAHTALEGIGRGEVFARLQLTHAYVVLLGSQFQGFCRDLHTEAAHRLSAAVDARLRDIFWLRLTAGRKVDRGNPTPGNLGSDFKRLELRLWPSLYELDATNEARRDRLEELCRWRNAIAHQDFSAVDGSALEIDTVRSWRRCCQRLAASMDRCVHGHVSSLVASEP